MNNEDEFDSSEGAGRKGADTSRGVLRDLVAFVRCAEKSYVLTLVFALALLAAVIYMIVTRDPVASFLYAI